MYIFIYIYIYTYINIYKYKDICIYIYKLPDPKKHQETSRNVYQKKLNISGTLPDFG